MVANHERGSKPKISKQEIVPYLKLMLVLTPKQVYLGLEMIFLFSNTKNRTPYSVRLIRSWPNLAPPFGRLVARRPGLITEYRPSDLGPLWG